MRVALISLEGQPREAGGDAVSIAGKSVAHRQLEFALAAGCERILVLGDGAAPEAVRLNHAAERAGAHFQALENARSLMGTLRPDDVLLVIAPGLLPDCPDVLPLLADPAVIVAPAAEAVAAGFERIDLERAWGGVLLIPGARVDALTQLSHDSDAAAALLRIGLQQRVTQVSLPSDALGRQAWSMVRAASAAALEREWLSRRRPALWGWSVSEAVAQRVAERLAVTADGPRTSTVFLAGAATALAGALALAWLQHGAAALGVLALAIVALRCGEALRGLLAVPRGDEPQLQTLALSILVDCALVSCTAAAMSEATLARFFAPLVLVGMVRMTAFPVRFRALTGLHDRALLAALLAFASIAGIASAAVMLAALVLLGFKLAESSALRITAV